MDVVYNCSKLCFKFLFIYFSELIVAKEVISS